jgi:signal transduction histidine kinase
MDSIPLHKSNVSLQAMVDSVVFMMQPYAKEMDVDLKVMVHPGVPATVSVDEDKVAWTLGMIIGNALRHVQRGSMFRQGGQITVRAATRNETGAVVIEVSDDGPGIPADIASHLFEPSQSRRRVGYALILGREIMLAHGGSMEVESTQDPDAHGTTVRVVFPGR